MTLRSVIGKIKRILIKSNLVVGLGVKCENKKVNFYYQTTKNNQSTHFKAVSDNGFDFSFKETVSLYSSEKFKKHSHKNEFLIMTNKGLLVITHNKKIHNGRKHYQTTVKILDIKNHYKIVWQADRPIWTEDQEWKNKIVYPIGTIEFKGKIISYWGVKGVGIYAVVHPIYQLIHGIRLESAVDLKKSIANPIIAPNKKNHWEAFNTFNPAAVYENGKVHIVYRAQGYDYVSVLGYANSDDGVKINRRLDQPIYIPIEPFEMVDKKSTKKTAARYMSGGGFGGCEDPRISKIGDRFYMTYVAYDGVTPPRIALTSISVEDFLNHRWFWETPVLISPPSIVDKSCCIFPEKINNKYVILHRVFPNILLDYVDSLNFDGKTWLKGQYSINIRDNMWDSRKIGAGAPPIKTAYGWLLIYYGVDDRDASQYKIGAMLLDLNDPTIVLHRTNSPILEPTEIYEHTGFKPGITYPCGAVVIHDILYVYYGAADSVVCVATANLQTFLDQLRFTETAKLEPTQIREISYL